MPMHSRSRARHSGMVVLLLLAAASDTLAQSPRGEFELDEVLVTGEQPGPAMWKVTNGDHTLWIMGTLTPLPAKMTWRSKQAGEVIARSGEVLGANRTGISVDGGVFTAMRYIPSIMRLRYNPDKARLGDVLPPDVYERWQGMYRRWFGKDPDAKERARPGYAASLLYQQALKKAGLSPRDVVWPVVKDLAGRHKVPIRQRRFITHVDDPKSLIKDLAQVPREKEVACLVETMDRIEQDIPVMRRRAQAWATGDLATLRALPAANQQESCFEAILEHPQVRELLHEQLEEMKRDRPGIIDWLLLTHDTSFAAIPVEDLLAEKGLLADLRGKGYVVEEPR